MVLLTKIQTMSTEELRRQCESAHFAFSGMTIAIRKEDCREGSILHQMFTELELRDNVQPK